MDNRSTYDRDIERAYQSLHTGRVAPEDPRIAERWAELCRMEPGIGELVSTWDESKQRGARSYVAHSTTARARVWARMLLSAKRCSACGCPVTTPGLCGECREPVRAVGFK